MKKLMQYFSGITRVLGGLLAFLIMLLGIREAWKELRERLRRRKMQNK